MPRAPKLTRRTLAAAMGLPVLGAVQTPPSNADARSVVRRDAMEVAAIKVPRETPPAFRFKP